MKELNNKGGEPEQDIRQNIRKKVIEEGRKGLRKRLMNLQDCKELDNIEKG